MSMTAVTTPTQQKSSREHLLDQARELGELAWSVREETERDRRIPDRVIDALRVSGLTRLCNQKRWGGAEADPMTLLDVGREIARGSASLGWVYSITSFHTWYMAFTSEQLQQEVWGADPDVLLADSFAPVGQIEPVTDGYLVSGQWRFASGIEWAGWVSVGGIAPAGDGEQPEMLMFFLPRAEITIHDDWHTLGLRGTASRAVTADRVFVPRHRVFALGRIAGPGSRGPIAEEAPLWRVPLMTMQGMAVMTTSIGVAQRMIEEFTETTRKRVRWLDPGARQREAPAAQLALAAAATQWDATWALAQAYAQEGWDRAQGGEWGLSDEERAKYFAWRGYIARSSVELSNELYIGSGAMALFDSHPLQQLFRDVHTAGVHVGTDRGDAYTSRGRVAMGFPGHPFH
jgi:3-hydroxy-9,10-secoandrosta-1,3,5(10)-triene-9,17-dione monooxygenase